MYFFALWLNKEWAALAGRIEVRGWPSSHGHCLHYAYYIIMIYRSIDAPARLHRGAKSRNFSFILLTFMYAKEFELRFNT